jgi:hypothetical protein
MDKVSICNVALSHLANSTEIQDLDAEPSKEAQACRRLFDLTRDEVLRDFPWPFATASAALTLFASNPNTEWGYSYRMPAGKLFFRRILSGVRNDSRQSRVSYRILSDDLGELVYTDMPNAIGEWTKQVVNTELWPPDFVAAFSLLLAGRIGPRVAGGDQFKLADRALRLYEQSRNKARANAANEEQLDEEPGSEFERARDGSGSGFTDCR